MPAEARDCSPEFSKEPWDLSAQNPLKLIGITKHVPLHPFKHLSPKYQGPDSLCLDYSVTSWPQLSAIRRDADYVLMAWPVADSSLHAYSGQTSQGPSTVIGFG